MRRTITPTVKKRARAAIKVWRVVAAVVIFAILVPTFIATHDEDHFFTFVLLLTALVSGLLMIIKQPLKKKMRKFIDSGVKLLLIGALLIILAFSTQDAHISVRYALLILSALFYAFGLQRLGISYMVGIP